MVHFLLWTTGSYSAGQWPPEISSLWPLKYTIKSVHSTLHILCLSVRYILTSSSHPQLHLFSAVIFSYKVLPTQYCMHFFFSPLCTVALQHVGTSWFNHPRASGWKLQIVNIFIMYLIFMEPCIVDDSVEILTRCSSVIEFIIPKFIEGSTCFERHTAHHQEL